MGLAFKPDIDDLRESPALLVNDTLITEGLTILSVEPNLESESTRELTSGSEALQQADIIVFLVAHKQFKDLTISKNKIVLDFVGLKN
jgi:UDP-N-acetyl-D-mannosaminuronic acid dehydrogenase